MTHNLPAALLALDGPDGLAVIGRTLHDLRGIRYNTDPGGNPPAPLGGGAGSAAAGCA
jgi:hypothetical protein